MGSTCDVIRVSRVGQFVLFSFSRCGECASMSLINTVSALNLGLRAIQMSLLYFTSNTKLKV